MKSGQKPRELVATANAPHTWRITSMDNNIIQFISSVGFPIVMCLIIFYYMQEETKNHRTETDSLKEAITELKIAITTLISKLEG